MDNTPSHSPEPGEPVMKQARTALSAVWFVPLVAILVAASMLVHSLLTQGPTLVISFRTAAGLTEGKTTVKYKDVTIGTVSSVELSDDGSHVVTKVTLTKSAHSVANAQSRFWVVRPRIGAGGASGIDTLLSGAYIAVDKGASEEQKTHFVGLENPPSVINGTPGKTFILHADDIGSLDINSPVYYRHIQVGRIASYNLDSDGRSVTLQVFVDAPYDRFVQGNTRFWNASGVDIALNAGGLKVNTQSLATVVAGGIAFATPDNANDATSASKAEYVLNKDQQTAMAPPNGPGNAILLRFDQSLRGLSVGAPVVFSGKELGRVTSVDLDYDEATHRFPTIVGIEIFPQRMGRVLEKIEKQKGHSDVQAGQFLKQLIQHGLRAQAKSANLLTGQLYISLDFVEHAPAVAFDPHAAPLWLPTLSTGGVDQIEEKINHIVDKLDKLPLDAIAAHLDASLGEFNTTLKQINGQFLPETTQTLQQARNTLGTAQGLLSQDAPLQQNLNQTLEEVRRSAQSVRSLTDYLGRHPEALLRGRKDLPNLSAPALKETPQ